MLYNEFYVLARIFLDSIQKKELTWRKPIFGSKSGSISYRLCQLTLIKGDKAPACSTPTVTAPAQ